MITIDVVVPAGPWALALAFVAATGFLGLMRWVVDVIT